MEDFYNISKSVFVILFINLFGTMYISCVNLAINLSPMNTLFISLIDLQYIVNISVSALVGILTVIKIIKTNKSK